MNTSGESAFVLEFRSRLRQFLQEELLLIRSVVAGSSNDRQGLSQKLFGTVKTVFDAADVTNLSTVALNVIESIFDWAEKSNKKRTQSSLAKFAQNFTQYSPEELNLYLELIAEEISFRWSHILQSFEADKDMAISQKFAMIAAFRIIDHCLRSNNLDLKETSKVILGVVQGRSGSGVQGVRNNSIKESGGLFGGLLDCVKFHRHTIEGCFSHSAIFCLTSAKPGTQGHFFLTPRTSFDDSSSKATEDDDQKVPKYGYVNVPLHELEPLQKKLTQHHPSPKSKPVSSINLRSYVFLHQDHFQEYIEYVRSFETPAQSTGAAGAAGAAPVQATSAPVATNVSNKKIFSKHTADKSKASRDIFDDFYQNGKDYVVHGHVDKEEAPVSDPAATIPTERVAKRKGTPQSFFEWLRSTLKGIPKDALFLLRGTFDGAFLMHEDASALFKNINLSHCNILNCNFKSNLEAVQMRKASLSNVTFEGMSLSYVDFTLSTFTSCTFTGSILNHCKLALATMTSCTFSGTSTATTDFNNIKHVDEFTKEGILSSLSTPKERSNVGGTITKAMESYKRDVDRCIKQIIDLQEEVTGIKEEVASTKREVKLLRKESEARERRTSEAHEAMRLNLDEKIKNSQDRVLALGEQINDKIMAELERKMSELPVSLKSTLQTTFNAVYFQRSSAMIAKLMKSPVEIQELIPVVYSTSGSDAATGASGSDGQSSRTIATPGTSGQDGQHATSATTLSLTIQALPEEETRMILVAPHDPNLDMYGVPMLNPLCNVKLSARGGDGGAGGRGGRGGTGISGKDGKPATPTASGTDGKDGGSGGNGANGGHGGNGGHGAEIKVHVYFEDLDLLALVDKKNCDWRRGHGGKAGEVGIGGAGGRGGKGGAAYKVYVRNEQGESVFSHENHAGDDGEPGVSGLDGLPGEKGLPGKDGSFQYMVIDVNTGLLESYKELFHIKTTSFSALAHASGIHEPGSRSMILDLVLENSSDMPTPSGTKRAGLVIFPRGSKVAQSHPTEVQRVLPSVPGKETLSISDKMFVFMNEAQGIVGADPYFQEEKVRLGLKIERLEKVLDGVACSPMAVCVTYPIHLSTMFGGHTIAPGTNVPICLKIRNFSRIAIGSQSMSARYVRLLVDLTDKSVSRDQLFFVSSDGAKHDLSYSFAFDIAFLGPDSTATIQGFVHLAKGAKLPFYSPVTISCRLLLAPQESSNSASSLTLIQAASHSFQVVELFSPPPGGVKLDMLIVVTHVSTFREVHSWKQLASMCNMTVAVWNVALYCGLDMPQLLAHMRPGGFIVFHNFPCVIENNLQDLEKIHFPVAFMHDHVFFEAAKSQGIKTIFINDCPTDKNIIDRLALPVIIKTVEAHSSRKQFLAALANAPGGGSRSDKYTVQIKRMLFTEPTRAQMEERASKVLRKAMRRDPETMFVMKSSFTPSPTSTGILRRFRLGDVDLRAALSATESSIAVLPRVFTDDLENVQFAFFKMMPFSEKLRLVTSPKTPAALVELLLDTISSDLCDELTIFTGLNFSMISSTRPLFRRHLKHFHAYVSHNFTSFLESGENRSLFFHMNVLLRCTLSFFVGDLSFVKPYYSERLLEFLVSYFPNLTRESFRAARTSFFDEYYIGSEAKEALATMKDQYNFRGSGANFNNWISLNFDKWHPREPTVTRITSTLFEFASDEEADTVLSAFVSKTLFKFNQVPLCPPPPGWAAAKEGHSFTQIRLLASQLALEEDLGDEEENESKQMVTTTAKEPARSDEAFDEFGFGAFGSSFADEVSNLEMAQVVLQQEASHEESETLGHIGFKESLGVDSSPPFEALESRDDPLPSLSWTQPAPRSADVPNMPGVGVLEVSEPTTSSATTTEDNEAHLPALMPLSSQVTGRTSVPDMNDFSFGFDEPSLMNEPILDLGHSYINVSPAAVTPVLTSGPLLHLGQQQSSSDATGVSTLELTLDIGHTYTNISNISSSRAEVAPAPTSRPSLALNKGRASNASQEMPSQLASVTFPSPSVTSSLLSSPSSVAAASVPGVPQQASRQASTSGPIPKKSESKALLGIEKPLIPGNTRMIVDPDFMHGSISREDSEQRLRASSVGAGAFLLRQKGTDIILSFLSSEGKIGHNRLARQNGRFMFDSKDLGSDTDVNGVFHGMKSLMPVALSQGVRPPAPPTQDGRHMSTTSRSSAANGRRLSVSGKPPYHHGPISREEAELRLRQANAGPGAFIVRESGTNTVVSYLGVNNTPVHKIITHKDGVYIVDGVSCGTSLNVAVDVLRPKTKPPLGKGVRCQE